MFGTHIPVSNATYYNTDDIIGVLNTATQYVQVRTGVTTLKVSEVAIRFYTGGEPINIYREYIPNEDRLWNRNRIVIGIKRKQGLYENELEGIVGLSSSEPEVPSALVNRLTAQILWELFQTSDLTRMLGVGEKQYLNMRGFEEMWSKVGGGLNLRVRINDKTDGSERDAAKKRVLMDKTLRQRMRIQSYVSEIELTEAHLANLRLKKAQTELNLAKAEAQLKNLEKD